MLKGINPIKLQLKPDCTDIIYDENAIFVKRVISICIFYLNEYSSNTENDVSNVRPVRHTFGT